MKLTMEVELEDTKYCNGCPMLCLHVPKNPMQGAKAFCEAVSTGKMLKSFYYGTRDEVKTEKISRPKRCPLKEDDK